MPELKNVKPKKKTAFLKMQKSQFTHVLKDVKN